MGDKEKAQFLRAEKYAMQSVVREFLSESRTAVCLRNRVHKKGQEEAELVKIWQHKETKKAFFSGLVVCGNVWLCPVCASKISEKRREELKIAFEKHRLNGGHIVMLTLTFRHSKSDRLKDLLEQFGQATESLFRGKRFDKIREEMGLIGRIRAFEVTYGDVNGWHPHLHIAFFCTKSFSIKKMETKIYGIWKERAKKYGLDMNRKRGINLKQANTVDDYIAKHGHWSFEMEMTKSHSKKGRVGSRTPFDFLRLYLDEPSDLLKYLFCEYAEAFHHKRQLQWSRGLKKRFLIEDKTDEELAKEKKEEAHELGFFSTAEWIYIRKNDLRSKILDMTENEGFEVTYNWLHEQMYKKEKTLSTINIDKDNVE